MQWVDLMMDPNVNFYEVQAAFEEYWKDKEVEKGKGWKQFKRWEAFMEPRVYPTGERPNPGILALQNASESAGENGYGFWEPMGPTTGNALEGIGRVNCIAYDPVNSNILWAGTPAGGIWKSTDLGQTWSTNTDLLTNLGVSDIEIDPTNPQIMYVGTGDADGSDTYSFGVLKSTDGGLSWNPTGLSYSLTSGRTIYDVYINPQNTNIIIATTSAGIQRSTDGGQNWSQTRGGSFSKIIQPGDDPNVLFSIQRGSNARIYTSVDNGVNWTQVNSSVLPTSGTRRGEIAVAPSDSNYIYALYGASNNGYYGMYRSTDGGSTWVQMSTSPNLLGWSTTGSDNGGQAWYDLALAINPDDKNEVFVGGVNIWSSSNGGITWNIAAHWTGSGGAPFVHADIHHLSFSPHSGHLYTGCDGGVYRDMPNQFVWDELNDGMNITQYYKIGASATDTALVIAGAQDNGTHLFDSGNWDRVRGGDGMDCAIDPKNPDIMYNSIYYGDFRKSANGGASFNATFNHPNISGNWVTPLIIDPQHPDTIFIGYDQVYRTTNGGASFNAISPSNMVGANIDNLAISPTDENYIYASEGNTLWYTADGGTSWSSVNTPSSNQITFIAVAYDDPQHIAITFSGYSGNAKIFESFDAGSTWTNRSSGLPNLPANCVTFQKDENKGIYVGTDAGVYYIDDNLSSWIKYSRQLPNVIVNELEINYVNRKIRAGTYGRGVYQSPLAGEAGSPVARFEIPNNACVGSAVNLVNTSLFDPEYFRWTISPASYTFLNGTNANSPSPVVSFNQDVVYNISLYVSNPLGEDSTLVVSALGGNGLPLPFTESFQDSITLGRWRGLQDDSINFNLISEGTEAYAQAPSYGNAGSFEMITPALNFSNTDSVWMSFDHAYRAANPGDSLIISAAGSCGSTFTRVAALGEDGNGSLVTGASVSGAFIPSTNDWCVACNTIDLSSFADSAGVRIKFEVKSAAGNNFYIDNVNLWGKANAAPFAAFTGPEEACALRTVQFTDQSTYIPDTYEWTFTGGTPATSSMQNPEVSYAVAGTYDVKLKVSNAFGEDSIVKTSQIVIDPATLVSISMQNVSDTLCPEEPNTFYVTAVNAGADPTFYWYANGNQIAVTDVDSLTLPNIVDGTEIYVTLSSSESCAFPVMAVSDTITINTYAPVAVSFNTTLTETCISAGNLQLSATPAGGTFYGNGVANTRFRPSIAGVGTHDLIYEVSGPNGCLSYDTLRLKVNADPVVTVGAIPDVCQSDSAFTLTVGSPAGGTYLGAGIYNGKFYPDSVNPGTYFISYAYTEGDCSTVYENTSVVVLANPATPQVNQLSNGDLECVSTGVTYQWYFNGVAISGATSQTHDPQADGDYSVVITTTSGCFSESAVVAVTGTMGIEDVELGGFKVYPNPTKNLLTIELSGNHSREYTFDIINMGGEKVLSEVITARVINHTLDISALPKGMYTLRLRTESGINTAKVIKN